MELFTSTLLEEIMILNEELELIEARKHELELRLDELVKDYLENTRLVN